MIWTAWKNGKHGEHNVAYGLKVPIEDRDKHFDRAWRTVKLELPMAEGPIEAEVNVAKDSFWTRTCHELINSEIKRWLIQQGLVPWPSGKPPKIKVVQKAEHHFVIIGQAAEIS